MGAVHVFARTLAAIGCSAGWRHRVEEFHQFIGVVIGASVLAYAAVFGSGDAFIGTGIVRVRFTVVVFGTQRISTHAVFVSELVLAGTLATTRQIESFTEDVIETFLIISRTRCLARATFVSTFDAIIVVRTAQAVAAHAVMAAVLVGTRGLTFTRRERFEVRRCIEDVFQSIRVAVVARGLARTALVRSRNAIFIVLAAQVVTAHTVVGSEEIRTSTLAFTAVTERRRFSKDVINSFRIIL
jgi:hypothetical protein